MRIALSGSHAAGKSSIARSFADLRPDYVIVDEPYHVMVSEGISFSDPPTREDFESQLERSAALIEGNPGKDTLFDRCPVDFLAYLHALPDRETRDPRWFDCVRDAVRRLDLIAYVPVEAPDRVALSSHELPRLRRVVDRTLRGWLVDDELGLAARVVELRGSVPERTERLAAFAEGALR